MLDHELPRRAGQFDISKELAAENEGKDKAIQDLLGQQERQSY